MTKIRSSFSFTMETTNTGSKNDTPKGYKTSPTYPAMEKTSLVDITSGKICQAGKQTKQRSINKVKEGGWRKRKHKP